MTNFFVNHDINVGELQSALKAYAQTEKNLKEPNPDLYYNRATIYEYLERYNEAVQDFTLAHQVDPNLGADQKCNNIIGFVSRSYNSIVNKGKLKSNRLTSMVGSIPRTIPNMDSQMTFVVLHVFQIQLCIFNIFLCFCCFCTEY